MRFNNLQDLLAGLLFVAFGAGALYYGQGYAVGSATRMGPGYLPTVLGWGLIFMGLVVAARAVVVKGGSIEAEDLRRVVLMVAWVLSIRFAILSAAPAPMTDVASFGWITWALVAVTAILTALLLLWARPQFFIIGSLLAFSALIERFGLLVATFAVVVLGAAASRDVRARETLILAVLGAAAAVGLFIYLLGQPMAPWIWNF